MEIKIIILFQQHISSIHNSSVVHKWLTLQPPAVNTHWSPQAMMRHPLRICVMHGRGEAAHKKYQALVTALSRATILTFWRRTFFSKFWHILYLKCE